MEHEVRLRVAVPFVHVRNSRTVDIRLARIGRNVIPFETGIAQVERVGVGVAVVNARVADDERFARLYRVLLSAAGNYVDGMDGHGAFPQVGSVSEILRGGEF